MAQSERKWSRIMFITGFVLAANVAFATVNKVYAGTSNCPDPVQTCKTNADCNNPNYPSCNLCFTTDIFTPYPCIYNH
jgi:hypothetical protein